MNVFPFAWTLSIPAGLLVALAAVLRARLPGERVLIVGSGSLARTILRQLEESGGRHYRIVGVAGDEHFQLQAGLDAASAPHRDGLESVVERAAPDRIVVAMAERRGAMPVKALLECRTRGMVVQEGSEFYERLTGKLAIESLAPSSLIFSSQPRSSALQGTLSRGMSVLVSAIGLLGCLPLLALLALAIRLDSRGPALFVQDRVGLRGRRFRLLKLRTMRPVDRSASEWARDNSDRVTRLGKWLRKFRLDELPQLVNVLRGDMNLVGPRPHPVSNFDLFTENIPYYWLRSMVRPGVTGWAQVRYGYANNLEEETEKMRYDLYYVKHRSLWLDLRILAETVGVVFLGQEEAQRAGIRRAKPVWARAGRAPEIDKGRPRGPAFATPVWEGAHAAPGLGDRESALRR